MATFLIILIIIVLLWPVLMRWLRGYMARRAENYLRSRMGMPPRDDSRRRRRGGTSAKPERPENERRPAEPIIPKDYAVDVEFTEVKDYSEADLLKSNPDGTVYHESQVEDAVYTEIKITRHE